MRDNTTSMLIYKLEDIIMKTIMNNIKETIKDACDILMTCTQIVLVIYAIVAIRLFNVTAEFIQTVKNK